MADLIGMNGAVKHGPLDGWVIALVSGACVIGKRIVSGERKTLSPVFAYSGGFQQTAQGMVVARIIQPMLGLSSVTAIDLPESAVVIDCGTLSNDETKSLLHGIETATQLQRELRAAEAGLQLVGAMPNLPPMRKS